MRFIYVFFIFVIFLSSCDDVFTGKDADPVPVTGVTLSKTYSQMPFGSTDQLVAYITPSNATNKKLIWSSDSESSATVTSTGRVIAQHGGTAIITAATDDGGDNRECEGEVKDYYVVNYGEAKIPGERVEVPVGFATFEMIYV